MRSPSPLLSPPTWKPGSGRASGHAEKNALKIGKSNQLCHIVSHNINHFDGIIKQDLKTQNTSDDETSQVDAPPAFQFLKTNHWFFKLIWSLRQIRNLADEVSLHDISIQFKHGSSDRCTQ